MINDTWIEYSETTYCFFTEFLPDLQLCLVLTLNHQSINEVGGEEHAKGKKQKYIRTLVLTTGLSHQRIQKDGQASSSPMSYHYRWHSFRLNYL